jgi:hypothetical protein
MTLIYGNARDWSQFREPIRHEKATTPIHLGLLTTPTVAEQF